MTRYDVSCCLIIHCALSGLRFQLLNQLFLCLSSVKSHFHSSFHDFVTRSTFTTIYYPSQHCNHSLSRASVIRSAIRPIIIYRALHNEDLASTKRQ